MTDYSVGNRLNDIAKEMRLANKIRVASDPAFPPELRQKLIAQITRELGIA
ncbi:hypothetical protein SEA_PUPPER_47 [Gordonia phage Pupper]|uniref:Uncharacterized protein n=1 Tax=Gordonia phage Pupper TaxID=2571249 RepID=A0A4Y6EII7_9CAUD|nr:hypothetical protein KHQ83_gp230 [Gordonia phage Pupper]QDF18533.1 hypothetical protein SEA_PUPPER_47 [Gordonia phage Pupper]